MQESSRNLYVIPGEKPLPNNCRNTVVSSLITLNQIIFELDRGNRKGINKRKNLLKSYINRL